MKFQIDVISDAQETRSVSRERVGALLRDRGVYPSEAFPHWFICEFPPGPMYDIFLHPSRTEEVTCISFFMLASEENVRHACGLAAAVAVALGWRVRDLQEGRQRWALEAGESALEELVPEEAVRRLAVLWQQGAYPGSERVASTPRLRRY